MKLNIAFKLFVLLNVVSHAASDATVYTDKTAWDAALTCPTSVEDFNSLPPSFTPATGGRVFVYFPNSDVGSPLTTAEGITFSRTSGDGPVQVVSGSYDGLNPNPAFIQPIDGTNFFFSGLRTSGHKLEIEFPFLIEAIGFSYKLGSTELLLLQFATPSGSAVQELSFGSTEFVGLVFDEPTSQVTLDCPDSGGTLHLNMDDLSYVPSDCADPGMLDDPHIKTFGGQWFDYHGECDLVLLQAKSLGLDLHVRTTIRYDYSYIEQAALRIGDDILGVSSWGNYALNGVDTADLTTVNMAGFPIQHTQVNKKQHTFEVMLGPEEKIILTTFKDWVSVKIHNGSSANFGDSVGIMGSYSGGMLARNGTAMVTAFEDPNSFGQEWQVRAEEPMLFRTVRSPQLPEEHCRLPSQVTKDRSRRRLGESIARSTAEKACAHLVGARKDACVFDVMASGDIDIAQTGY